MYAESASPNPAQHEISIDYLAAHADVSRAVRSYLRAIDRPRRRQAWHFVTAWLWNARQEGMATGALRRNTPLHDLVCSYHADAQRRLDSCREAEARGVRNATA